MMIQFIRYPNVKTLFIILLLALSFSRTKIEKNGDILRLAIPSVSLGFTALETNLEGTKYLFKSLILCQLYTETLKRITHKRRPNGGCCKSFPSGHTSAAFNGAAFVHKRYGKIFALPLYFGAIYTAYSRVYANKHYVEDVIAGASLGIFCGFYYNNKYNNAITLIPYIHYKSFGFSIIKKL